MNNLERIRTARGMTQETLALSAGKTNVVKGGFEKNRLIQQSGGSFVVIDTAQGGETGGTLAEGPSTVYRRSFPCWYKQMPEAASPEAWGLRPPTSTRRVYTGALLAVTNAPLFLLLSALVHVGPDERLYIPLSAWNLPELLQYIGVRVVVQVHHDPCRVGRSPGFLCCGICHLVTSTLLEKGRLAPPPPGHCWSFAIAILSSSSTISCVV